MSSRWRRCTGRVVLSSGLLGGCAGTALVAGQGPSDGGASSVDSGAPPAVDSGGVVVPDTGSPPLYDSGSATSPDASITEEGGCPTGAAAKIEPAGFWDESGIPPTTNLVTFKFLNRTNGTFQDSELYWEDASSAGDGQSHSFADSPTYDAPALSGRLYVYICSAQDSANYASCSSSPSSSKYFDWLEHNIFTQGTDTVWAGNTTRVNEFGLKLAFRADYATGTPDTRGEDYGTFCEARATTFQRFVNEVPTEFQMLAQPPFAPYQIIEPGAGGMLDAYPTYYNSWEQQIWTANGITLSLPGNDLTGAPLSTLPDLTAAIHRHTGGTAGSFNSDGTIASSSTICTDDTTFYQADPSDHYSKFWHDHALLNKTYGFNYDDSCNTESSYVYATDPTFHTRRRRLVRPASRAP